MPQHFYYLSEVQSIIRFRGTRGKNGHGNHKAGTKTELIKVCHSKLEHFEKC